MLSAPNSENFETVQDILNSLNNLPPPLSSHHSLLSAAKQPKYEDNFFTKEGFLRFSVCYEGLKHPWSLANTATCKKLPGIDRHVDSSKSIPNSAVDLAAHVPNARKPKVEGERSTSPTKLETVLKPGTPTKAVASVPSTSVYSPNNGEERVEIAELQQFEQDNAVTNDAEQPSSSSIKLESALHPATATKSVALTSNSSQSATCSKNVESTQALEDRHVTQIEKSALSPTQPASPTKTGPSVSSSSSCRFSWLTPKQHLTYLRLYPLYLGGRTKSLLGAESLLLFQNLHGKVLREQEEYHHSQVKEMAEKRVFDYFPRHVAEHTQSRISRKKDRVSTLPKMWKPLNTVDIGTITVEKKDPVLSHRQTLSQVGQVCAFQRLQLPSVLPMTVDVLNTAPSTESKPSNCWYKQEQLTCSLDTHLLQLLMNSSEAQLPDIVLSSSVMTALVDTHAPHYSSAWHIPIVVKMVGTKKIVFLDKPLLKPHTTLKERSTTFYRLALHKAALDPSSPHNRRLSEALHQSEPTSPSVEIGTHPYPDNLTYNLWSFGSMKLMIRCKIHSMIPDPNPTVRVSMLFC